MIKNYLLFILLICTQIIQAQQKYYAVNGEIDLSTVNFDDNEIIKLNGDWNFYWNAHIPPQDFIENVEPNQTGYFRLPGLWNAYIVDGTSVAGKGFVTYHLKIKLPAEKKMYGLRIPRIETSYRLWVDDKLLKEAGIAGTSTENTIPSWETAWLIFYPQGTSVHITIQISNFDHRKGGIAQSIEFGSQTAVRGTQNRIYNINIFLLAVLIIMTFHHLGVYFLNKKEKKSLSFAIHTASTALYLASHGEMIINYLFGTLNYEFNVKLSWWSVLFGILSFTWFLYYAFPKFYNKKYIRILTIVIGIFSIVILVLPALYFTYLLLVLFILISVMLIFTLQGILKASLVKEIGARLSLIGTLIFMLAALNDMLYDNGTIKTFLAVPIGTFVFILIQSFMLSLKSSIAQKELEAVNKKIKALDTIKGRLLSEPNYKLSLAAQILNQELGFYKTYFIIPDDDALIVQAANDPDAKMYENRLPELMMIEQKTEHNFIPLELIIKHLEKKEPTLISDFEKNIISINYFKKSSTNYCYIYPIIENQNIKLILYFEGKGNLNAFKTELLSLLESQIITILENNKFLTELEELNRTLEEKVEHRTAEVYQQKEEIAAQRDEIEEKNTRLKIALEQKEYVNRTLTDSINYAKKIQQSLLPSKKAFIGIFPDSFVFLKPKDILSGDFYWIKQIDLNILGQSNRFKIIAAIDCTGHGVPGALMSIIANDLLDQAIIEHHLIEPSLILESMEYGLRSRLQSDKYDERSKDGMDMSLIVINETKKEFKFAGAHNPVYYLPAGVNEMEVLPATPYSIGGFEVKDIKKQFKQTTLQYKSGETIYMFSDGYYDQIGGIKERKFMKNAFKELLLTIYEKNMAEQHNILETTLNNWKSSSKQIDDILVIGFRF
jgi:serine phosphatase RsbU (regulator of sigma subunit)